MKHLYEAHEYYLMLLAFRNLAFIIVLDLENEYYIFVVCMYYFSVSFVLS